MEVPTSMMYVKVGVHQTHRSFIPYRLIMINLLAISKPHSLFKFYPVHCSLINVPHEVRMHHIVNGRTILVYLPYKFLPFKIEKILVIPSI